MLSSKLWIPCRFELDRSLGSRRLGDDGSVDDDDDDVGEESIPAPGCPHLAEVFRQYNLGMHDDATDMSYPCVCITAWQLEHNTTRQDTTPHHTTPRHTTPHPLL